ncbi:MAG: glycoside hydrolase family 99-like domain-containing protein [Thermoguttaceae bacterium]|nr:glycoside hydrolase family 99-like domain-containing protein [Thermoguttaceae bacterium]
MIKHHILALFFLLFSLGFAVSAEDRPLLGAIRWDAWYGTIPDEGLRAATSWPGANPESKAGPNPGGEAQRNLKPERFEYRRPFFSTMDEKGNLVEINGNRQEVMDQEIDYAVRAGLDFWAFTVYPEDCPLSLCFQKFISSPKKDQMKFCFFLVCASAYGRFADDPEIREYVLRYVTDPSYLKVQGNRPVFYVGFLNPEIDAKLKNGVWAEFCEKVQAKGLGKPYVVTDHGHSPEFLKNYVAEMGFDAVGRYCHTDSTAENAPYAQLVQQAEEWTKSCKDAGLNVSPICMTGFDRRPRFISPTSWELWHKPGEFLERFFQSGTPEEIADHIARNVDFLRKSPNADGVNLVLIYAWNECDEGGWIIPTQILGTARIDALSQKLKEQKINPN